MSEHANIQGLEFKLQSHLNLFGKARVNVVNNVNVIKYRLSKKEVK